MAVLSALTLYPIKSCAGIALREATLTEAGLMTGYIYDREWMVVDQAGRFLSQREYPRMALIVPRLKSDTLELRAPGMLRLEIPLGLPEPDGAPLLGVQVWDDQLQAYDCGELAATWFSKAIGTACRLVRFPAHAERAVSTKWTGGVAATTLFSDGYPLLLAGAASLDDLNEKLLAAGRAALPMERFRPNLVVSELSAFEEDYVDTFECGDAVLKPVKPCSRCSIPSVDQRTGETGPDPLDILQSYRAKPELDGAICFGMNAIVLAGTGTTLKIGQEMHVNLAF